jgi:hypothetical protein
MHLDPEECCSAPVSHEKMATQQAAGDCTPRNKSALTFSYYLELDSQLLNEEMAKKHDGSQEGDIEALALTYCNNLHRPYNMGSMNQGDKSCNSYLGGKRC